MGSSRKDIKNLSAVTNDNTDQDIAKNSYYGFMKLFKNNVKKGNKNIHNPVLAATANATEAERDKHIAFIIEESIGLRR